MTAQTPGCGPNSEARKRAAEGAVGSEADYRAAVERVLALADKWEELAGEGTDTWRVFGPQDVSVPFAVKSIRDAVTPPERRPS